VNVINTGPVNVTYQLLLQYLGPPDDLDVLEILNSIDPQAVTIGGGDLREKLIQRMNGLPSADLISLFVEAFQTYKTWSQRGVLLGLIDQLEMNGHHCPEFFWILISSEVLYEVENISDIKIVSGLLKRTGGVNMARSYLATILLQGDVRKRRNAIKAFYPIGHTALTLKIVERIANQEQDHELLNIIYQDALWSLGPPDNPASLKKDDFAYLHQFFQRGYLSSDPRVATASHQALAILRSVPSQHEKPD